MIIIIINVIIKEENTKNMEIKIMIPRIPRRTHDWRHILTALSYYTPKTVLES